MVRRLLVERAHAPYYLLTEAGYEVQLASPNGGACQADALSDPRDPSGDSAEDLISAGFIGAPKLSALIEQTLPVGDVRLGDFDALLVAGGQAPMFNFDSAHALHRKFAEFYEAGKWWRRLMPWASRRRAPRARGELRARRTLERVRRARREPHHRPTGASTGPIEGSGA